MAGVTTNNGWDYPTSTDYVKDGATAIQTLATDIDTSVGTGLLAWQSWAPTLSGGWANGNGTWTAARYCKIGKTVIAAGYFVVGSTTTKGTVLTVSLPISSAEARNINGIAWCGVGFASTLSTLSVYPSSGSTVQLSAIGTAGAYTNLASVTATAPITWVTGSVISFSVIYEVA